MYNVSYFQITLSYYMLCHNYVFTSERLTCKTNYMIKKNEKPTGIFLANSKAKTLKSL